MTPSASSLMRQQPRNPTQRKSSWSSRLSLQNAWGSTRRKYRGSRYCRLYVAQRLATNHNNQDERDRLRAQLQAAAKGGNATEARLVEKDEYIASLRAEGESLSRKNGELEAAARKLRSILREVELDRDKAWQCMEPDVFYGVFLGGSYHHIQKRKMQHLIVYMQ